MNRFCQLNPAIPSVQENTLAIFLVLKSKAVSLCAKPGVLLNEFHFFHSEQICHRLNLLVANFDLPGPTATCRAALAFIIDISGHEFSQHSQQKGGSALMDAAQRISDAVMLSMFVFLY